MVTAMPTSGLHKLQPYKVQYTITDTPSVPLQLAVTASTPGHTASTTLSFSEISIAPLCSDSIRSHLQLLLPRRLRLSHFLPAHSALASSVNNTVTHTLAF